MVKTLGDGRAINWSCRPFKEDVGGGSCCSEVPTNLVYSWISYSPHEDINEGFTEGQ